MFKVTRDSYVRSYSTILDLLLDFFIEIFLKEFRINQIVLYSLISIVLSCHLRYMGRQDLEASL